MALDRHPWRTYHPAQFQDEYDSHPASNELRSPPPADFDNPEDLFGSQGYLRGAMTLQALRQKVGSHDFFIILRTWAKQHKYGNVSTAQFIRLSERCLDKTSMRSSRRGSIHPRSLRSAEALVARVVSVGGCCDDHRR
ncbi:MAG TPA: hypothetical protein VI036_03915, partial [Propionibacteriaceae bacterium]